MKIFLFGNGKASKYAFEELKKNNIIDLHKFSKKKIIRKSILIDLSNKKYIKFLIRKCIKNKTKLILGTTGYSKKDILLIKNASKKIPIFICQNFNKNFWQFIKILKFSKKILKKYKNSIIETHSIKKKDSPSGSSFIISKITKPYSINSIRILNSLGKHIVIFSNGKSTLKLEHVCNKKNGMFSLLKKTLKYIIKKKRGFFTIK